MSLLRSFHSAGPITLHQIGSRKSTGKARDQKGSFPPTPGGEGNSSPDFPVFMTFSAGGRFRFRFGGVWRIKNSLPNT